MSGIPLCWIPAEKGKEGKEDETSMVPLCGNSDCRIALLCGAAMAVESPDVYVREWIVDGEVRGAYVSGSDSKITQAVIPATYESAQYGTLPVVRIGAEAFRARHNLTRVIIPDSVSTIASRAFFDCYKLNDITMPVSVTLEAENPFNYSNRDAAALAVRITAGSD